MEILLSTAWIRDDVRRLENVIGYIDGIEVNSIGDGNFSKDLYTFIRQNGLKVSSIHASAGPHKEQENAYYLPNIADPDSKLRDYDIKQLMFTAEWAGKIGVDRIVVHAGKINDNTLKEMYIDYKNQAIKKPDTEILVKLKQEIMERREKLVPPYLDSLKESLNKVCNQFPEIGFYLETRVNYYEIPTPSEAFHLFKNLNYRNLGYWNDIGHSYIQNELGFINFNEWKLNLNEYCGGLHIHDINDNLKDHYPPGSGNALISKMLEGFPQDIPWVLEINFRHSPDELITGINIYKKLIDPLFVH